MIRCSIIVAAHRAPLRPPPPAPKTASRGSLARAWLRVGRSAPQPTGAPWESRPRYDSAWRGAVLPQNGNGFQLAAYHGGPIDWQDDPSNPYHMTPQFQSIMTPTKEWDIAGKIVKISAGIEPVREQLLASDLGLPGGRKTFYDVYSMGPSSLPGAERIANIPGTPSFYYSPYHYRAGPGVPNAWIQIRYGGQ